MRTQTLGASRGRFWVVTGFEVLERDVGLWVGITITYLGMGFVLGQIPYIGTLLFVWLSPIFAAGALTAADALERGLTARDAFSGDTVTERLRHGFGESVAALFQVFWQPDKTLAVMIVGTMTLGGMVVVEVLAQLLQVDGPALSAMIAGSVGPAIWAPAVLSLILIGALRLALILISLYAVQLVTLGDLSAFVAIERGARALARHLLPLALFGAVLVVPMFVSAHFGVLARYGVAAVLIPLLLLGTFASYKDLFEA